MQVINMHDLIMINGQCSAMLAMQHPVHQSWKINHKNYSTTQRVLEVEPIFQEIVSSYSPLYVVLFLQYHACMRQAGVKAFCHDSIAGTLLCSRRCILSRVNNMKPNEWRIIHIVIEAERLQRGRHFFACTPSPKNLDITRVHFCLDPPACSFFPGPPLWPVFFPWTLPLLRRLSYWLSLRTPPPVINDRSLTKFYTKLALSLN